jgi:eukaryotic-like serine/threonine-protein kinase
MERERWGQVEQIFHAALQVEESRRGELVRQSCAGDEDLRREVESLLAHQSEAGSFIETPAFEREAIAAGVRAIPAPVNSMRDLKDALVAHYRILDEIGIGGMGVVYKAEDTNLGRPVALKFLPDHLAKDSAAVERFRREARAASALNHPGICTIHDVGNEGGRYYIAMELLEGQTLREAISRGPLELQRALDIAIQIAEGLDASHRKGIFHRDIKPANLFLTTAGQTKILDFGIAKMAYNTANRAPTAVSTELTSSNAVLGTLDYMSPEQVLGKPLDARTDIFSLGVVLYEMTTGKRPFTGETSGAIQDSILHKKPLTLGRLNPEFPPELDQVVSKALEKDPDLRYQSVAELRTDLRRLRRDSTSVEQVDVREQNKRKPRVYFWAGTTALLAAVVLLGLYLRTRSANAPAENVNVVPLTSYPGAEQFPTFSPDGNEVAFAWTGGEYGLDFDLYRKQVGSEKAVRLTTTHASTALAPAWSPDGRYIAYIRVGPDYSGLYLVPALGGPERKLSDVSGDVYNTPFLSWSPDSRWLAFPGHDNSRSSAVLAGTRIYLLNVETLDRRVLAYPSSTCIEALGPAFSPAGDQIASYCADDFGVGGIYIQSVHGVVVRKFQRLDGEFGGLTWTSDGKFLVYSLNRFLWRVAVMGGHPQKLQFGQNATAPAVARVGARLAYAQQNSWRNQLNIWRLDLSAPDKAKNVPVKVISSSRGQEEPRISPDAKRIAFLSARSGNSEIWVADSDGSNLIQLTSFGGPTTGTPRWSPDSRRIVFDSRASGHVQLYLVDADGGPAQRVQTGTPDASMPFWSHDGRWIYFLVSENKKRIWKVAAEGGAAIQLTGDGGDVPQESFDGSRVFYETNFRLRSVSINGGDEQEYREIGTTPGLWFIDRWTPGPNGIYFLDSSKTPATLNLLNLRTRKISHVSDISGRLTDWGSGPSLSAEGHTLVFATADGMEGDLMLVEGFH